MSKLNYLTTTRPDVAYSVIVVSQFLFALWTSHRDDVIRIIWYLKCAPSIELLYSNYGHEHIVSFLDADWVGSPIDRQSTTGYYVFIEENIILWKSKKRAVILRSSIEYEYRA